jgi:hypothetical protein
VLFSLPNHKNVKGTKYPPGCFYDEISQALHINNGAHYGFSNFAEEKEGSRCGKNLKCLCEECHTCGEHEYSPGGAGRSICKRCIHKIFVDNVNAKYGCSEKCPPGKEEFYADQACRDCPANFYRSEHMDRCEPCAYGTEAKLPGSSKCTPSDEFVLRASETKRLQDMQGIMFSHVNDRVLNAHHTTEKVRQLYDDMERNKDNHVGSCQEERRSRVAVHPSILFTEKQEDHGLTCLSINRDEFVNAYCNFRELLADTVETYNLNSDKTIKSYWPELCCDEDDPQRCGENVDVDKQKLIIPFALVRGGDFTHENVYDELYRSLKQDGYIHNGMIRILDDFSTYSLNDTVTKNYIEYFKTKVNAYFKRTHLCGPRVFRAPDNEQDYMCQLFFSYSHMFRKFHTGVAMLFGDVTTDLIKPKHRNKKRIPNNVFIQLRSNNPQQIQDARRLMNARSSRPYYHRFAEIMQTQKVMNPKKKTKMEQEKQKKQIATQKKEIAKERGIIARLEKDFLIKKKKENPGKCEQGKRLIGVSRAEMNTLKAEMCPAYNLDLKDTRIMNVAFVYAEKFIKDVYDQEGQALKQKLSENSVYSVTDDCPSPMFTANDISLQHLKTHVPAARAVSPIQKDWVYVIKIDGNKNENGYLISELDNNKCEMNTQYLPRTEIGIQVYFDKDKCCTEIKDYTECMQKVVERRANSTMQKECELMRLDENIDSETGPDYPLAFEFSVSGSKFAFQRTGFRVEGTKYTSPTGSNIFKFGSPVNHGNIENSLPMFLEEMEIAPDLGSSFAEIENFQQIKHNRLQHRLSQMQSSNSTGKCNGKSASEIFSMLTVSQDPNLDLKFDCETSKALCDCLSSQSKLMDEVVFTSPNNLDTFTLYGDGQFVYYDCNDNNLCPPKSGSGSQRRRRLLQRKGRGC